MRALRLSPKARADLDAIWTYTAGQWGADQAEDYVRALGQTMNLLSLRPRLGRNIDDIRKGYFKFPAGSHVIFYRLVPNAVEVVRILHKSMDVDSHLYMLRWSAEQDFVSFDQIPSIAILGTSQLRLI